MLYQIYHSTQFLYAHNVSLSHNLVRLKPRNTPFQTLVDFSLTTDPALSEMENYDDYFGNHLYHVLIREGHQHLKVTARSCISMDIAAIDAHQLTHDFAKVLSYEQVLSTLRTNNGDILDAKQYCLPSRFISHASIDLHEYARLSFEPSKSLYESVEEFMGRIFSDFSFVSGFSDISTPVNEVFSQRKGVCQDFAHLAITALRSLGLAARYVSGYLETTPPDGETKLFGVDASHAWFSVFIPGFGWFDFDPTNNIIPTYQHIVLGHGRDFGDCSPMQGVVLGSGSAYLNVMVDVARDKTPIIVEEK